MRASFISHQIEAHIRTEEAGSPGGTQLELINYTFESRVIIIIQNQISIMHAFTCTSTSTSTLVLG